MKKSKSVKYIILIVALLNATLISNFNIQPTFAQEASRTGASTGLCKSSRRINGIVTSEKVISFTFDDGPWPTNTNAVMNSFEKYGWKATFFMVGRNIKANPAIAKSVASRGHEVGNHSMTHPTTQSAIAKEVVTTNNVVKSYTGVAPTYFRAPGGNFGSSYSSPREVAFRNGLCNIWTDSDLGDWRSPRVSSSTLCARFKSKVRPGSIILLHDGGSHSQTVNAVPCMLAWAKANGYTALPLKELLSRGYTSGYRYNYIY